MVHSESFAPAETRQARILILGSMPGVKSLQEQQYYAHPQNAFWKIMAELFEFPQELSYRQRLQQLRDQKIALWDVMQTCFRTGSLDSAIEEDSIVPNDFENFFHQHPHIKQIFFNGTKAEHAFNKHVLPELSETHQAIARLRLPSTSPANARMKQEEKRAAWEIVRVTLEKK